MDAAARFPDSVAILGPGLLGGSLALALKSDFGAAVDVRLWARRDAALQEATGAADLLTNDLEKATRDAEMVVLATPVGIMASLCSQLAPYLRPGTLVTDVGSVKGSLVRPIREALSRSDVPYLGSHPMAGSEQTGFKAARADLFQRAVCILTPDESNAPADIERLETFWLRLGCKTLRMSAEEHDRKIARISHLPHAVASAVVRAALAADPTAAECTGNGFRDATRIAGGDPGMWAGILLENRDQVLAALHDVSSQITELVEILRRLDEEALRRYLDAARSLRKHVPAAR
ncbi:MAG: prephenate dehydrogenase/arogenate dehydrogenase family protein [Verrucomicrobiaceae bacterium]|nr:prephenate dehydrogenase/arogenate dehydrogenase family protein [Verrucomicrobiaceae bacterium]